MADEQLKDPNRRASARTVIRQPATLACGDTSLPVQTLDVGQGGLCFLAPRPVAPGSRCSVAFDVPLGGEPVPIGASLKVVYSSYLAPGQFKIGSLFTELGDEAARVLARYTAAA